MFWVGEMNFLIDSVASRTQMRHAQVFTRRQFPCPSQTELAPTGPTPTRRPPTAGRHLWDTRLPPALGR